MVKVGDRLVFYLVIKPLSYLPLRVLFFFSNITYFLAYSIVKYRRNVVRENLINSFPEKNLLEIKKIEKDFYRHFTDFIFESIKSISITEREVLKRTQIKNPELLDRYYQEGKNVLVLCGHYNNWEFYALSLPKKIKHTAYSLYQPLKNKFLDRVILNSRKRNGMKLIASKKVVSFFQEENNKPKLIVVVNDQSPTNPNKAYWNTFLNQTTGWNIGPEKLAKKYDYTVLFGHSVALSRGIYQVEFKLISEHAQSTDNDYITDKYASLLEEIIRIHPESWLWSHKRWKHKKE
ncbi:acetyltransferase [Putridiphycobacter roseus]|uniref:Acetyltransferase n=1 Tax=Putridiphycobacter roseus TaxID=2219161 RepID=A0A2W1NDR6_9FLAO|nr:acetyltransferase [Putridiphycobacter roseus]PZE17253.1 acetyltransferase [Putridiphycobacter roseus]